MPNQHCVNGSQIVRSRRLPPPTLFERCEFFLKQKFSSSNTTQDIQHKLREDLRRIESVLSCVDSVGRSLELLKFARMCVAHSLGLTKFKITNVDAARCSVQYCADDARRRLQADGKLQATVRLSKLEFDVIAKCIDRNSFALSARNFMELLSCRWIW